MECGYVTYQVVGGEQQHDRGGVLLEQVHGGDGRRRRSVAPDGFEKYTQRGHADAAHLLCDQKTMFVVAHDQRGTRILQAGQTQHGFLQHGVLAGQGQKLLGQRGTGQGPQAGAGASGEDDGIQ